MRVPNLVLLSLLLSLIASPVWAAGSGVGTAATGSAGVGIGAGSSATGSAGVNTNMPAGPLMITPGNAPAPNTNGTDTSVNGSASVNTNTNVTPPDVQPANSNAGMPNPHALGQVYGGTVPCNGSDPQQPCTYNNTTSQANPMKTTTSLGATSTTTVP